MKINLFFHKYLNDKFINDSLWSLFANFAGKGLSLLSGIFIARMLGKSTFGEYGMIRNTILSLSILSTFGLGYTATKFIAEYKNEKKEYIRYITNKCMNITLFVSTLIAVFLFVFSKSIATTILENSKLSGGLKILSVLIILNGLVTTQTGVISGLSKFKELARVNVVSGIALFLSTIIFTFFWGFNGALYSLLVSQIINIFLNYRIVNNFYLENNININNFNNRGLVNEILKFSTPVALQEIIFSFSMWLGSWLIIKLGTYSDLGLYNAAIQWGNIILFIPAILRNVILSHLSSSESEEKHNLLIKKTIYINFGITFIASCVVFLFSSFIEKGYGESYQGLNQLIVISSFTSVFVSVSNVYSQAYMSKNMNWKMFFIRLFRDFGTLLIFIFLVLRLKFLVPNAMIYCGFFINLLFLGLMFYFYRGQKK